MKCQHMACHQCEDADLAAMRDEVELLRADLARCREVQKATAEGWRHEVAEVASIVGAPPHTAELAACVRAEVERLRAEVQAAREALGLAWCSDEWSLADGIRRKTHALESMIK